MKPIYALSSTMLLCVLLYTSATAQVLNFSAHLGTSLTSFAKDDSFSSSSFGLMVGGSASYNFSGPFRAILHIDYTELKGFTEGSTIQTSEFTAVAKNQATIRLGEATIMGGYKLPLSFLGDIAPYVTAGGSIGYNFRTTNKELTTYTYPGFQFQTRDIENVTSNYSQLLYSLQAGVRFEIPLDAGIFTALLFDFRYRRNVNPVVSGLSFSGNLNATDSYANSLLASVGFQF
jgi:hypothetical protein